MITPSFSPTATERVLPKLALDFTTASLDSRVTFTRALNTASRVNSSGYIETVNADTPRFDYDPVTLVCKGLLIEESRTNLIYPSTTAGWTTSDATYGTPVTGPDNTADASYLKDTTSTGFHYIVVGFSGTNANYTTSVYAKAKPGELSWIELRFYNGSSNVGQAYFDVANGIIGTVTAGTAAITNAGNGWYRCSVTANPGAGTNCGHYILLANGNDGAIYTGTGTGLYLWGGQAELGAFATSLIPTTTTALTRNADVATMTGTNFSSWFNASEGTFSTVSLTASEAESSIIKTVQDTANHISIFNRTAGRIAGTVRLAGTFYTASSTGGTRNQFHTFAFGYRNNKGVGALNGGSLLNSSPEVIGLPTSTYFEIGGLGALNGYIKKIFYWPQLLTNNEVRSFSKQG